MKKHAVKDTCSGHPETKMKNYQKISGFCRGKISRGANKMKTGGQAVVAPTGSFGVKRPPILREI